MKTSNVLASVLFGAVAAAAPFDKRALVTKTELVIETVVIYKTVYGDEVPIAPATTTPGLFFEQPASSKVAATSTAIYTPSVVEAHAPSSSSSSAVPAPSSKAPAPSSQAPAPSSAPTSTSAYTPPVVEAPSSAYTPAPEPTSSYTPPPAPSSTYVAPAPVSSAVEAAQPSSAPATSNPTGTKMHGDITIYDNNGGFGSCGTALWDTDMIVALSHVTMGPSTYNVMTGAATNPWCGQNITISYQGNEVKATIMDTCPGCAGADIDLSLAVWKKLTGLDEKTRLQADWWKS